ncbi:MAG: hypothetical protein AAFQ52_01630, partial [Chloroflexota bacterium]
QEKPKRKNDDRQVEWAFDFANVGESVKNVFNNFAGEEEVHESSFTASKAGVESARYEISFAAGKNTIGALDASSEYLMEAHLTHVGEIEFSEEGEAAKTVVIKQKQAKGNVGSSFKQGMRALGSDKNLEWDVKVATDIPASIDINGGVGPTKVDLTGMNVTTLYMNAGVGKFTVILPQQAEDVVVDLNTGVGQTQVYVPEGTSGVLDVNAGVGAVDITIPPNAAVQINAEGGIGSVDVPKSLKRMTKKEFMEMGGVFQSEGFELAEDRLIIHYNGGVGALHVREAELV